jgi:hypothetical protein
MRVAAELHREVAARRGRPTEEREGRYPHACVADWYEPPQPRFVLLCEPLDRVSSIRRRHSIGVAGARRAFARAPTDRGWIRPSGAAVRLDVLGGLGSAHHGSSLTC